MKYRKQERELASNQGRVCRCARRKCANRHFPLLGNSSRFLQADGEHSVLFARIAQLAILGLVFATGLHATGIANEIVQLAFGLVLGAIAVAVALTILASRPSLRAQARSDGLRSADTSLSGSTSRRPVTSPQSTCTFSMISAVHVLNIVTIIRTRGGTGRCA